MSGPIDVLIVDDEPKICQVLEQVLMARGCVVRSATDGLAGLSQFKEKPADIVITDIRMPKLSGIELVRELKHMDPLLNIVVITAFPSVEGAVEAMRCGACDFITKPFDIAQIQAILYRCNQRISLTRQLRKSGEGVVKLEELNRRLAELNDLKSQFLATISHEINTPLAVMSEWIYMLSDGTLGGLKPNQQNAIDVLINAYDRLRHLLQQLVDLMHGHEIVIQRSARDIQNLLRQAIEAVIPKATAKSVTITCHFPQDQVTAEIDPIRCQAAFEYLLDNAVKFNHENGRVEVELNYSRESANVCIRDTGIGIPLGEQQNVFQPFYQVDRRLNRAYEGAGIGLALAKRYVELHGGSITLSSEVEKGTTVVATIPRPSAGVTLPRRDSLGL